MKIKILPRKTKQENKNPFVNCPFMTICKEEVSDTSKGWTNAQQTLLNDLFN